MLIVGLTGGIGAGKSTVAGLLAQRGAAVIDVDALGREIVAPDGSAVEAVAARFGDEVRAGDGGIDRAALAQIVFSDEGELAALNEISHPAINELLDERVEALAAAGRTGGGGAPEIVVFDMAVLVESALGRDTKHPYELVVTVEAPTEVRLKRLGERGMTEADAKARLESQASDEQRREAADFVIGNGADTAALEGATDELWQALCRLASERAA